VQISTQVFIGKNAKLIKTNTTNPIIADSKSFTFSKYLSQQNTDNDINKFRNSKVSAISLSEGKKSIIIWMGIADLYEDLTHQKGFHSNLNTLIQMSMYAQRKKLYNFAQDKQLRRKLLKQLGYRSALYFLTLSYQIHIYP
jgi:hypothetical protein